MRKYLQIVAGVSLAAALAGCFSFQHTDQMSLRGKENMRGVNGEKLCEHMLVSNYGWYLFNTWPIVCGNAREDSNSHWAFFRNDVDETILQDRLTKYAAKRDVDVSDLVMFNQEKIFLEIYNVPVPIPYVCCYREMQLSCVLTPRTDSKKASSEKLRRDMDNLLKSLPTEGGAK